MLSSFNRARKTNKERIFRPLSKRESDLWEVRKLERSEEVGNCVNREVGISGSGNIGKWEYREVGVHALRGLCDE